MFDERAVEEVDDKPSVFVNVVTARGAGAVVGVGGGAGCVDNQSPGAQHAAKLEGQAFELAGGQGHTEEHVGVGRIDAVVGQRQRLAHVVGGHAHHAGQAGSARLGGDGLDGAGGDVQCRHVQ